MGKKKEKKITGAEKTLKKTERNLDKKTKKELREKGETEIEAIVSQFEEQGSKRQQLIEEKCSQPSARCNMTLVPHPERDILIMFGGEYFNGAKTFVYNDVFYYDIRSNEWTQVKAPNAPAPRSAHQAVVVHHGGGQMWIFGGEFTSPSQSQFYHYKDLWVFNLKDQTWQKISTSGGPSARSGHRMVACRKTIFVFGGFHDNTRDFKYFNDLHAFNVETQRWMKLDISGIPPSPRSGCVMAATQDGNHVVIYGGYSKENVKKDVEKGKVHTDMFMLSVDSKCKLDAVPSKWKWVNVKQSGSRPTARCSTSLVVTGSNRAMLFGGVVDEEEDEESMTGTFYNDMYSLELDKGRWHRVLLRKKRNTEIRRKRRKGKGNESGDDEDASDMSDIDENVKKMKVSGDDVDAEQKTERVQPTASTVYDDGIFTVRVSGVTSKPGNVVTEDNTSEETIFTPSPRMNPVLAVKNGALYMYGGSYEEGDRQLTLSDFYSLDVNKLNEWKTIIQQDTASMDWQESESEDEESDSELGATAGKSSAKNSNKKKIEDDDEDDDDDSEDDDDDDSEDDDSEESEEEDEDEQAPPVKSGEEAEEYFDRTMDYWLESAADVAKKEGIDANAKMMKKAASKMAKEFWKEQKSH